MIEDNVRNQLDIFFEDMPNAIKAMYKEGMFDPDKLKGNELKNGMIFYCGGVKYTIQVTMEKE